MKTFYTIGDTHGLGLKNFQLNLKKLVKDPNNMIIFVGDYCDSFTLDDNQHIESLKEIIKFKKDNPENVILLLGNHDIAYWYNTVPYINISGYRYSYAIQMHEIFQTNKELFQIAYQYENYLWTHAGVQNYWFNWIFNASKEEKQTTDIATLLNNHFLINNSTLYVSGTARRGSHRSGGVIWCDRSELHNSPLKGYVQIVGHTPHKGGLPVTYTSYNGQTYICVDVNGYLQLEYEKENKMKQSIYSYINMADDSKSMQKSIISNFKIPNTAVHKMTVDY
jgi:predicted phosphodiesterase